jgi:hypothetical protein
VYKLDLAMTFQPETYRMAREPEYLDQRFGKHQTSPCQTAPCHCPSHSLQPEQSRVTSPTEQSLHSDEGGFLIAVHQHSPPGKPECLLLRRRRYGRIAGSAGEELFEQRRNGVCDGREQNEQDKERNPRGTGPEAIEIRDGDVLG